MAKKLFLENDDYAARVIVSIEVTQRDEGTTTKPRGTCMPQSSLGQ